MGKVSNITHGQPSAAKVILYSMKIILAIAIGMVCSSCATMSPEERARFQQAFGRAAGAMQEQQSRELDSLNQREPAQNTRCNYSPDGYGGWRQVCF